jgi:mycothiol synthase
MNIDTYRLRDFRPSDYAQEARIWAHFNPETIFTVEELRHYDEHVLTAPLTKVKIVAEERATGRAVGFGYLQSDVESFDPQTFWINCLVDPEHEHRGLGHALAETASREAAQRRARRLWAAVRADNARANRFLARQGFTEKRRSWRSKLDLAQAANLPDRTEELSRAGITFTTLAEENSADPELIRELYDLTVATTGDEPRLGAYTPISFERFVERDLRGPSFFPEAFLLARAGRRFVAMCLLTRLEGEPATLSQSFTGTRKEFRGRGIASELKRRSVEFGRSHGYRYIRTGNDSLNAPMLAINDKLGFKKERERIVAEKILGG